MSACSVLQDIQNALQTVSNFLTSPSSLNPTTAASLSTTIELINGAVRELPINNTLKSDILNRLAEAQTILQFNGSLGLNSAEQILAVLQILQIAALKVNNLHLPCPQGTVTVTTNTFSSLCNLCR